MVVQETIEKMCRCLFFVALLAISLLALLPQERAVISTGWDKTNHLLAFFVLLALLDNGYSFRRFWLRSVLPIFLYGILIECVQYFLPDRFFSLLDIIGDVVGLLLYTAIRPYLKNKISSFLVGEADEFP